MKTRVVVNRLSKLVADNSPALFAAAGVTGVITTAVLTGRATFKAAELIREENHIRNVNELADMDTKASFLLVWKIYIPPAASGSLCIIAIVLATRVGTRRAAALATAYSLSQKTFDEYREKVVEKIGSNKERSVRDEIAQDQVRKDTSSSEVVIVGFHDVLCYEAFTGRYFTSSVDILKKAENKINHRLNSEGYVSLTDLYDLIGLPRTSHSDEVGWKNDSLIELRFSATITEDERPCISVNYRVEPIRDYYRFG